MENYICKKYDRCQRRDCRYCANNKARQYYHKMLDKLNPDAKNLLLTLTMPHDHADDELCLQLPRLKKFRKEFMRRRSMKGTGGFYVVDATANDGFHCHLHMIMEVPDDFDSQQMVEDWCKISGASIRHQKVQQINRTPNHAVSYVSKAVDLFDDDKALFIWVQNTLGVRLRGSFGSWYGTKTTKETPIGHQQQTTSQEAKRSCSYNGTQLNTFDHPKSSRLDDLRLYLHKQMLKDIRTKAMQPYLDAITKHQNE